MGCIDLVKNSSYGRDDEEFGTAERIVMDLTMTEGKVVGLEIVGIETSASSKKSSRLCY